MTGCPSIADGSMDWTLPPPPWSASERLAALRRYDMLDASREPDFDNLCRIAARGCRTPAAGITLIGADRQFFKSEIGLGVGELPLALSLCAHALGDSGAFVVPDTREDPRFSTHPMVAAGPRLRFYAGARITTDDGIVLGSVCVFDSVPRPGGLTPEEADTLLAVARQVMTQLEHKRTLAALVRREKDLERIHRIAGVGGFEVELHPDLRGRRSPQYLDIHGLPADAVEETHEDWLRRLHPEDRGRAEGQLFEAIRSGVTSYRTEYRIVRPSDGEVRWISAFVEIERDRDGRPLRLVGAHVDVSERKEAEEALRRSEQRLRAVLDTMPQMVWSTKPDGHHDYFNRRWYEVTGVPEGTTDGEGWNDVFHPDDQARAWARWRRSLETGEPYEIEYRLRQRSGGYRWVLGRALPIRDADGRIERWFGTCTDIEDLKTTEAALRRTEQRLSVALNAFGAIGIWDWNVPADRIVCDERFARLFSVNPEEAGSGGLPIGDLTRAIHPEDRPEVEASIARALEMGGEYECEYRVVLGDGSIRWVNARGFCERDADGRPTRFPGAVVDVTSRKIAEAALAARSAQLEALLDTAPVAVWFTHDPHVRHLIRNGYAARLMDLPEGETASFSQYEKGALAHLALRQNGVVAPPERLPLQRAMRGEDVRDEEFELVFIDGRHPPKTLISSASPLRDDRGTIVGAVAVSIDITARKRVEEAHELLARELSHRIQNIFAVVSGLAGLTARNHPEAGGFVSKFRERLNALALAHEFVRPNARPSAEGQTVQGLLRLLLAPYLHEDHARVLIEGDDAPLGATSATALALCLHEQATNAVKYGALSAESGRIEISCMREAETFTLHWRERGGPAIAGAPQRHGFGTLLAGRSVTRQLGGDLVHEWLPEGLELRLRLRCADLSV